jgi:membrane fusion protein, multidrug efflux system
MNYRIYGSVGIFMAVVLMLAGIGCVKKLQIDAMMAAPPPAMPKVAVTLATAKPIAFRRASTAVGTVLAPQFVNLRTELTGTITHLPMQAGSVVKKGDVLLKLDDSIEQAQLKGAKAARQIADSTVRRNRDAARLNAITELEVEQSEATLAQADAEIERLQALIAKKTLYAPFDSRVGLFQFHIGQYLAEGSTVTTLQGIENFVHIDFSVPQHVADSVQLKQVVKLMTQPDALDATIIAMDSQADRITRSVMVRARLDNPPASLQPNDSVKINIEYGDSIEAIAIPSVAVRRTPTSSLVYIAVKDDKNELHASMRDVALLSSMGEFAVVESGINAGDEVVADGSFKVTEAAAIIDVNATPQAADTAATQKPAPDAGTN